MRTVQARLATAVVLTVAGLAYSQVPLLHYTFDEASSGTTAVLDQGSGTAANGSFSGSATRTGNTPGGFSKGALNLNFAGNTTYVSGGNAGKLNALTNLTITAWINMRANAAINDRLVSWAQTGQIGKGFELSTPAGGITATALKLIAVILNNSLPSTTTFDAFEQWVFVAVVWNNTQVMFYKGGEAAGTAVSQLGAAVNCSAASTDTISGQLRIGSTALTTNDRTPPVWMDDVRIYGVVLSQAQLEVIRRDNILAKGTVISFL